jgi:hypothetical protein
VNGVFVPVDEKQNSRPLYRKDGDPNVWLRICPNDKWMVSPNEDKVANNNNGWAESVNTGLSLPTDASVWNVWDGNVWVEQAAVRVEFAVCVHEA